MDIKTIIEGILSEEKEDSIILEIHKTGSQLFINNPRDLDYVAICENFTKNRKRFHVKIDSITYDIIIFDINYVYIQLNFNNPFYENGDWRLYNYMLQIKEVVYGNYNLNWNMLDYKDEYLLFLKERYETSIGKLKIKTKFTKAYAHYYIILKIYENNSIEITNEMLNDIQILYSGGDNVLPLVNWVENQLKKIKT